MRIIEQLGHNTAGATTHHLLDALYLSSSMVSYAASVTNHNKELANQLQHEFYSFDHAIPALAMISFFSLYALSANYFAREKISDTRIQLFALSWPYFRDLLSGIKNGRHAVINVSYLAQNLAHTSFYQIANPIGIIIGALLAINLVWYRNMNRNREQMIANNHMMLRQSSQQAKTLIASHSIFQRSINYASAAFDGLTDGMYLYGCLLMLIGVHALSAGAPLIAALITISVISLASLISRLQTEYEAQQKLIASGIPYQNHLPIASVKLSLVGQATFFIGRAFLSGAKNGLAAITSMQNFITSIAGKAILGVAAVITGIFYAVYLALLTASKYIKEHKQQSSFPTTLNNNILGVR